MAKKIDGAKVRRRKEALREVKHMQANTDSAKDMKAMKKRPSGRTFDGVSRPSNDLYRENFDNLGKVRVECPNVDFYSGIIMKAIGISPEMFTVIFATGRTVGWIWTPEDSCYSLHWLFDVVHVNSSNSQCVHIHNSGRICGLDMVTQMLQKCAQTAPEMQS